VPTDKSILFITVFFIIALLLGFFASQYPHLTLFWAVSALAIFLVAFINTEFGLYILIFSMLLSPEFGVSQIEGGAALGRGVTLRLDDFLLAVIGLSWFAKNAIHKELGLILRTPLNKPIFYYITACIVSTGIGIMAGRVDVKTGFFYVLKYFEYIIVYFMVANHIESRSQINRFLFCMFLTCFITAIYGMMQIPGGGRVSAPFEGELGEPNTFGGYLVFIGALAAGMFPKIDNFRMKILLGCMILFIIPPFLFTESRTSYMAAIPACFALGYQTDRKPLIIGLIVILLLLSPFLVPKRVKDRILFTFSQREHVEQIQVGDLRLDTSTSARLISWKQAFWDWTKKPIIGYGVTGYGFIDAQIPRILTETGIVGLIAFLYLLYSIFRLALDNLKKLKSPYLVGLLNGFIAGYVGLLFHAIGANTFIIVRIMEPFWLMVGIISVLPFVHSDEDSTGYSSDGGPVKRFRGVRGLV